MTNFQKNVFGAREMQLRRIPHWEKCGHRGTVKTDPAYQRISDCVLCINRVCKQVRIMNHLGDCWLNELVIGRCSCHKSFERDDNDQSINWFSCPVLFYHG